MTDRATRLVLLCCNAVFLVVSVGCIFLCFMAQGGARLRVTALNRVGSLDATKVATAAPAGCVIPAAGPTPAMINR